MADSKLDPKVGEAPKPPVAKSTIDSPNEELPSLEGKTTTVLVVLMASPKVDKNPSFELVTVSFLDNPTSKLTANLVIGKLRSESKGKLSGSLRGLCRPGGERRTKTL